RQIGVAEQLLHRTEVGAPVEQMRRERMAQCVGVGRGGRPTVEYAANVTGRQRPSPPVEKDDIAWRGVSDQGGAAIRQPHGDGFGRRWCHRDLALLRALAPDDDEAPAEVDVAWSQRTQLTYPQTAPVQKLDDADVAQRDGIVGRRAPRRRGEQHVELTTGEDVWKPRVTLGGRQPRGGINGDRADTR